MSVCYKQRLCGKALMIKICIFFTWPPHLCSEFPFTLSLLLVFSLYNFFLQVYISWGVSLASTASQYHYEPREGLLSIFHFFFFFFCFYLHSWTFTHHVLLESPLVQGFVLMMYFSEKIVALLFILPLNSQCLPSDHASAFYSAPWKQVVPSACPYTLWGPDCSHSL